MSDPVWIPLYIAIVAGVFPLLTLLVQVYQARVISLLEKNTNSMKDALVKITGESENAKGNLQGIADEKARVALVKEKEGL